MFALSCCRGDYLNAAQWPVTRELLRQSPGERLVFADYCAKITADGGTKKRVLLITNKAVYDLYASNHQVRRRIPIGTDAGTSTGQRHMTRETSAG